MSVRVVLSVALLSATLAFADDTPPPPDKPPVLLIGLKVGVLVPQVFSKLGSHVTGGLEVGWITPAFSSRLAVTAELMYGQPSSTQQLSDPRTGAPVTFTVTERILGLYAGPRFFFLPPQQRFVPWIGAGVRVQFIQSRTSGTSSSYFGMNAETGTHAAFGAQLGFGVRLGPGMVTIDAQLTVSPINHLITGQADVGDLAFRAGWVMTF